MTTEILDERGERPDDAREPWQWDEATWRGYVTTVQPGASLAPKSWPNDARAAVAISFDSDHETSPLRDGKTSPGALAQGGYGSRTGVPRVLAVLRHYKIHATFFVPAVSALLHPEEIRACINDGHEIALHGWIHERNVLLPEQVERELTLRSVETLCGLVGSVPRGIRTPSWDFGPHTLKIIRDLGLLYDSSLMSDDDPYELLEQGLPTGVVELPVDWIRDDAPYLMMDRYGALRPYTVPHDILTVWRDELDGAYNEGGVFQLTLHPHIIGHRSRIVILEELLEYALDRNVWCATHAQVAEYVASEAARANSRCS